MVKKGVLVNGDFQLELKDSDGKLLRSIIHFGAFKDKREQLFKGKETIEIDIEDFDDIAYKYCSHYGN